MEILVGWKEICAYLKIHRRTTKRWEKIKKLPHFFRGRQIAVEKIVLDFWVSELKK